MSIRIGQKFRVLCRYRPIGDPGRGLERKKAGRGGGNEREIKVMRDQSCISRRRMLVEKPEMTDEILHLLSLRYHSNWRVASIAGSSAPRNCAKLEDFLEIPVCILLNHNMYPTSNIEINSFIPTHNQPPLTPPNNNIKCLH